MGQHRAVHWDIPGLRRCWDAGTAQSPGPDGRPPPDMSDHPKLTRQRHVSPIDILVPPVLYYPVSPEKQTRSLPSTNERAEFRVSANPTMVTGTAAKARAARTPHLPGGSAQIQPFAHFVRHNYPGINTSKNFALFCNPLIRKPFNPTRINTSGNKDLKSIRINTSGSKDLKSFRINTSKKHGRGEGIPHLGVDKIIPTVVPASAERASHASIRAAMPHCKPYRATVSLGPQ
jgi:hypothetical protein